MVEAATRLISIQLNAGHPGIRAAALAADKQALNYYVAEMTLLGVWQIHQNTGGWPWPHADWPAFMRACDWLGRKVRHPGTVH